MSEYTKYIRHLPLKSLDECEKALKSLKVDEYGYIPTAESYNKRMSDIKRSISGILLGLSELASCDEVTQELERKEYRIQALERYLAHKNYISVFIQTFM